MKNTVPVLYNIMYSFKGWQNNKNNAFSSKRCTSNEKTCYCYTVYYENRTTYLYITYNKKVLFVKKYFTLLWVFTDFPILLFYFLNINTAITRQLIRTARTLEAEWWQVCGGSVGTGTKEDESSTGHSWAAGFHHITDRSRLARVFKLEPFMSLNFQIFFSDRGYWIRWYGGPPVFTSITWKVQKTYKI